MTFIALNVEDDELAAAGGRLLAQLDGIDPNRVEIARVAQVIGPNAGLVHREAGGDITAGDIAERLAVASTRLAYLLIDCCRFRATVEANVLDFLAAVRRAAEGGEALAMITADSDDTVDATPSMEVI